MRRILFLSLFASLALVQITHAADDVAKKPTIIKASSSSQAIPWKVQRTEWTSEDEKLFSEFVKSIGESKCNSIDSCLKGPGNPYRQSDTDDVHWYTDCADLPYVLRSYFAMKRGLPFTYTNHVSSMDSADLTPEQLSRALTGYEDDDYEERTYAENKARNNANANYSKNGNCPDQRRVMKAGMPANQTNYIDFVNKMINTVSSGTYRTNPELFSNPDITKDCDSGSNTFTDMYPIKMKAIKPGTVVYDPSGHVAVVYKVEDDGTIRMIDAHPDNSLTHITYGPTFSRSRPSHGAGFKGWRPIKIVSDPTNPSKTTVVGTPDSEIADFSTEQFYGQIPNANGWSKGQFLTEDGKYVDFYGYVSSNVSKKNADIDPISEFSSKLEDLCRDVKYRSDSVASAISSGINKEAHPNVLPDNIYGTTGEWETYSTPSRDARLKVETNDLFKYTQKVLKMASSRDPKLKYSGSNLQKDLLDIFNKQSDACEIKYTNSNGIDVTLKLDDVIKRIFKISFDPYHSIELRWGDDSVCRNSKSEECQWYQGETFLRNQHERSYDAQMSFSLGGLLQDFETRDPHNGNGRTDTIDVDIKGLLTNQLSNKTSAQKYAPTMQQ